jgi:uncharacterized protein (DUF1499 family)
MLIVLAATLGCARGPNVPLPAELAPPPSTPNCVHTEADPADAEHHIAPYAFTEPPDAIWARLHEVVIAMPRVELVAEQPDYRHYVFTTGMMRFRDDVQFVLDRDEGVIRYRSASRVGQSDLGVNRRRMETIREVLQPR